MPRKHSPAKLVRSIVAGVVLLSGYLCLPTPSRAEDLYQYYLRKFTPQQNEVYGRAVSGLFPEATVDEQTQARQECQAYSYVVYHRTRWHDLRNNVGLTHQYASHIQQACADYGVPFPLAMAILSWENSGSTQAMSGSACAGMGQMSQGAMAESHAYAGSVSLGARFVYLGCRLVRTTLLPLRDVMRSRHAWPTESLVPSVAHAEPRWLALAQRWNTGARHAALARQAKVSDERMLADSNIEDSVLFMRILLDSYGNRPDLAASAYHNGQRNNDDLLRDYLKRIDPGDANFTSQDRAPLLHALEVHHITYLTLWNDRRCREMLNGFRTMDGDVTTAANRSEALGDESDIYPWKVASALAASLASADEVADLEARFDGAQDHAETLGWKADGASRTLVSKGHPIKVVPELAGYLERLHQRLQEVAGKKAGVALYPAKPALVAVELNSQAASALGGLLNEDWLFDRIYLSRGTVGRWKVCLNPRFGRDYLTPMPPP